MKHKIFILFAATLLLGSCQKKAPQQPVPTSEAVIDDMINIGEIGECEAIIADPSLKDAKGDRAWSQKDSGLIRIKNGDKYYLRRTTDDGNVTAVTYRYVDNN